MKIGIIGAMTKEVEALKQAMEDRRDAVISGMEFSAGRLCGREAVVAVAGIGKVSAAMCTQTMILRYAPDAIINTGVAGGIGKGLKVTDVVLATAVAQHDMDTTAFGDPMGLIPALDRIEMPCDEALCAGLERAAARVGIPLKRGLVVSGDQFIGSQEQIERILAHFDALAAEMEGAAIGQVCALNGVPFAVVRAISDGGDEDAHMSYPQFLEIAAARSVSLLTEYLKS